MQLSNIYFSVEDTKTAISDLKYLFSNYKVNKEELVSVYNRYRTNDTHKGDDATAAKDYINTVEMGFLESMGIIKQKFLKMHEHSLESFAEKVDAHPNARIDTDTLDMVQEDLCEFFGKLDDYCTEFDDIATDLQNRYGHMWTFKHPCTTAARDSLADICGGYDKNAGFISKVRRKLVEFEKDEVEYIDSLLLEEDIDDLQFKMVNTGLMLSNFSLVNSVQNVNILDNIGKTNSKATSKSTHQKNNDNNHKKMMIKQYKRL